MTHKIFNNNIFFVGFTGDKKKQVKYLDFKLKNRSSDKHITIITIGVPG